MNAIRSCLLIFYFLTHLLFCVAITKDDLFPFGTEDERLPSDRDDVSAPEFQLSIPIVFYESNYRTIFVNDNGLLSFLTEVPSFFNAQFPLTYPIIAPLYSDVDTRGTGTIYYRESKSPELLQQANQEITRHFSRGSSFRASSLLIVTWDEVGRFNMQTSEKNTVQVVIATNGNESYAFFMYPQNGIQWIQGDGKISNLPDARTQVGFMSGDGRLFVLPGSGTDQVLNFDKMSNVNRPGIWIFQIGNVGPGGNLIHPDIDGDKSLAQTGPQQCSNALYPCPPTAICNDYQDGFCCACSKEYFGNGRNCLAINAPLRMNGKVNGVVNDIQIDNSDLHAYIVTQEGRQYTAISKVPPSIGYDMQSLYLIGGIIGWQFASAKPEAPNGFMITGGVFNRTAEITFPQTGHQIIINEQFLGPDVFNFLKVNSEIRGSLPSIPFGSKLEIEDYEEEYTRVSAGQIRSHSTRSISYGENSLNIPLVLDQTITYTECPFEPVNEQISTTKLKAARNYIVYDNREQIIRYASTNKMTTLSVTDPCREGKAKCGEHSNCVVDGDEFKCICDRGYERSYREVSSSEVIECGDINECALDRDNCHMMADCINLPGSFTCACKSGYLGNGIQCQQELRCEDLNCDENAECMKVPQRNPECRCKAGFNGDGLSCSKTPEVEDCRTYNLCDANAECEENPATQRYQCFCRAGFRGDGIVCMEEPGACDALDNCGTDADCIYDVNQNQYFCECNQGFIGDGFNCQSEAAYQSCNVVNNCHPYGQCIFDPRSGKYECRCSNGFVGDGFQCTRSDQISCATRPDVCSKDADCVYGECRCRQGFRGNGIICGPIDECNPSEDSCDANAKCLYSTIFNGYECKCNPGYNGTGRTCTVQTDVACNVINNCHKDASCLFDAQTSKYKCECNAGYSGDGKRRCDTQISCNILNNCDVKAECKYSFEAQGYRCQCNNGFVGDGFACRAIRSCREDLNLCDRNAECVYVDNVQGYTCQCRYGFIGDGSQCTIAPRYEGDYLIFTQGMSLLQIPFEPSSKNSGKLLMTKENQIAVGLDVDCIEGHVYWTDVANKVIYRAAYNGTSVETVIAHDLLSPEGISIDWTSRNIYLTDSMKDTIEVVSMDGKMRKILINEDLTDPRGIVVHPGSGKMYWSDWNRLSPKIEVANMDGSERNILVEKDLGLPNNLAIDFDHSDVCWTDAGVRRIECVNLYGQNRRIIYTPTAYPFDLTVAGDFLYWTDWEIKFIQKINRNGGVPVPLELPLGGNGKVYSIVTIPHHCPRVSSACSVHNGGCKHLCLPTGRSRTCLCPDNVDCSDAV